MTSEIQVLLQVLLYSRDDTGFVTGFAIQAACRACLTGVGWRNLVVTLRDYSVSTSRETFTLRDYSVSTSRET